MPVQVDPRAGSKDIVQPLRKLGVEVEVARMEFGDISWLGNGPNGDPVTVGVELKRWGDVIACIGSGRFAGHQLPGLLESFNHVWLLIYGQVRCNWSNGLMEELRQDRYWAPVGGGRGWYARDVEGWLLSMQILGMTRVQREPSLEAAAQWIKTASNWYSRTEHKSHLAMFSNKEIYGDEALVMKPPLARRIAAELPGVGITRSTIVAQKFPTMKLMADASESQWMNLVVDDGKRFGKRGSQVWRAIRGNNDK